ncbi:BCNT-domain-containing protein [Mollisia scopiformis]|uniref:SWR1-complex protein 5 n=1 Tax=Mollisia scopiformis TaxID=149040 RepID=A0A194WYW7_MOLSC|nr:BCNT-domain-containing protein [Mollisia scopiformis]KUJ12787.1 BCNT-domain-containing protein [Mollisia scopiformis]
MPPEIVPSDEEEYLSDEDSDFAPDAVPAQPDSDSEPEETSAPQKKRKRAAEEEPEAEDLGFENSGDEAIIGDGLKEKKRRKKKGKKDEEDEGGEGGFVKTRSMRAVEEVKKKPLANTAAATIDVDAVWAAMLSGKPVVEQTSQPQSQSQPSTEPQEEIRKEVRSPSTTFGEEPKSMVMIKRTYTFAGKVHTEQKLVPRNSAEARLFLESQSAPSSSKEKEKETEKAPPDLTPSTTHPNKRPLKLARRSIFEPVPENLPQRKDLHFGIRRSETGVALVEVRTGKEKKLNTVEKSAMDWASFVDKEGIKDELDAAGKSKGAYKARQEFLARVEAKKVEDERRARGLPVL